MTTLESKSILFIVPRFHTNLMGWVSALKSEGYSVNVDVLLVGKTENHEVVKPNVIDESFLSRLIGKTKYGQAGFNKPRSFPSFVRYFKHMHRTNPDLVIIRDLSRWFSIVAFVTAILQKRNIWLYNLSDVQTPLSSKRKFIYNLLHSLFGAINISPVNSDRMNELDSDGHRHFLPLIPYQVISKQSQLVDRTDSEIKLLSIGKFEQRKNIPLLINAVKDLINEGVKLKLDIVGEVTTSEQKKIYEHCESIIHEFGLIKSISLFKNVPHNQISSFYLNNDLFVLPAHSEPFGVVVVEALGYGLPVICSDDCGSKCYVLPGVTGGYFDKNSIVSLSDVIRHWANKVIYSKGDIIAARSALTYGVSDFILRFRELLDGK